MNDYTTSLQSAIQPNITFHRLFPPYVDYGRKVIILKPFTVR